MSSSIPFTLPPSFTREEREAHEAVRAAAPAPAHAHATKPKKQKKALKDQRFDEVLRSEFMQDALLAQLIADAELSMGGVTRSHPLSSVRLRDRVAWTHGLDWMVWDGDSGIWRSQSKEHITAIVRDTLTDIFQARIRAGGTLVSMDEVKSLTPLLTTRKLRDVFALLPGLLEVPVEAWDAEPELLNTRNGVLDLRTLELRPHVPEHRFTKLAGGSFNADGGPLGADFLAILSAVPVETQDWLRLRFGQAATGYMTPDDLMVLLDGDGSNGKSTLLVAVMKALGSYAVRVPESLLMGGPGAHPTELMALQGARLAVIEETPEARSLNVQRLKAIIGTPEITARRMYSDFVTYRASHSLFLATNFRPVISETDEGTWRRLALAKFPFRFTSTPTAEHERQGDPALRARIENGEPAILADTLRWIASGAAETLMHGMPEAPARVQEDTLAWRAESDIILGFLTSSVEFDADSQVLSGELYGDFTAYLHAAGHPRLNLAMFLQRLMTHDLAKRNVLAKARVRTATLDPASLSRPFLSRHAPLPSESQVTVIRGLRLVDRSEETLHKMRTDWIAALASAEAAV